MAVEKQDRVPLIEHPVQAISFDGLQFDRIAIQVQAL
jgi:hypothetical protein